jgi:hypothetical protein
MFVNGGNATSDECWHNVIAQGLANPLEVVVLSPTVAHA